MAEWIKFNGEKIKFTNDRSAHRNDDEDNRNICNKTSNSNKLLGTNVNLDKVLEQKHEPDMHVLATGINPLDSDLNDLVKIWQGNESCDDNYEYENNLLQEEVRILDQDQSPIIESNRQIREEASCELDELSPLSPKQADSLRGNFFGSPPRILVPKKSQEKLVNGRSPKEEKNVHRVQFNKKDSRQSQREKAQPDSPSISTSSSSSSEDNSSLGQFSEARPPDGGWGWVVVAASFMVNLIADGITFSFGVIYVEFLNYFRAGKAKTAWIGSLFMAMPMLSGPIASFLTNRYGCKKVTIAGSILSTTGFVISSFSNSMEVLILTFGIIAGFGLSLCFVAAIVIVAYYFDKKRSFATGLSVCGSGIGTFIFAPLTQYLIDEYGWRGATLILAGLFLNLAVCGCLMRDLEWTTTIVKAKTMERKKNRKKKRSKMHSSSGDSFSASSSANTNTQTPHIDPKEALTPAMIIENLRTQDEEDSSKLFSSLVNLPTFLKNGEKVPLEVFELLSTRENVYKMLMKNYPSLLIASKSFSDSGTLGEQFSNTYVANFSSCPDGHDADDERDKDAQNEYPNQRGNTLPSYLWWIKKVNAAEDSPSRRSSNLEQQRRLQSSYLKDVRVHRHSLTYRGAMLNINRCRLRASSCPDICRNSVTTIDDKKMAWNSGLWEFWDVLVDMVDLSHFSNSKFLLFAISNFFLQLWYDVPYVYLTDNAIETGFSETDASMLISIIGITNTGGEIFLGWVGDRTWVNASVVYALCITICGALTSLIPLVVTKYYALCAVAGSFGLFISANYSLTSIILVELISLERFTNAYGLLLLVQGLANLMGPPLAGWLYDITGTYNLSFYLAGFFIAFSGVILLVMPLIDLCRRFINGTRNEKSSDDFTGINNV